MPADIVEVTIKGLMPTANGCAVFLGNDEKVFVIYVDPSVGSAISMTINGVKLLAARLEGADAKTLRDTLDKLKDKLKTAVVVLAAVEGDKVQIAAGVTADTVGRVKAGDLVNFVAQQVGGKGGGKPDMAMAGGSEPGGERHRRPAPAL